MRDLLKIIKNGIFSENPIFVLALGLCPALAVTTNMNIGLAMGIAVTFVMAGSMFIVSLLTYVLHAVHHKIRVPAYLTIIGAFVTIVSLVMRGYFPALYKELGIYISLIVVFTVILARAEVWASKQPLHRAFADGLGMGLGFTLGMLIVCFFRELLGNGTLFDHPLFGPDFPKVLIMILPPGGFITIGLLMAFFKWCEKIMRRKAG
jgi:Na+-translocating ferredoxin:NAD+ oxidoreductase subunit E